MGVEHIGGNTGTEFLKQRFPTLASSTEVNQAANRIVGRTGIEVPREPHARIQNYLDRFKEVVERKDPTEKERGVRAFKKILGERYVVRVEDIPDSYWQAQLRVARDRGEAGDWQDLKEEQVRKTKQDHLAHTKEDQKGSLEEWIDYLAADKSSYLPDYLKYWAFQGMLRLERYEKGEDGKPGRFPERPTGKQRSAKMFPEVNERALKFIAQSYDTKSKNQPIHFRYDIPRPAREAFLKGLDARDFRSLYGWGQEYIPPINKEEMQTTQGQWVTYPQGSEGRILSKTLQGKGSGWCIAGENLAQDYLSRGDLFVYYTRDREGNPTIPRVVIVSAGNHVTEVRGIEWEENVDSSIKTTNIISDKLREIPGGEEFFEIDMDTKQLTAIDRKMTSGVGLDRNELTFLYELDRPIKYFGYKPDPRIAELRAKRSPEQDITVIFDCDPSGIAHSAGEIKAGTKAYVGLLTPGIFDIVQQFGVEHVYTRFPEGRIRIEDDTIGGKTKAQLGNDLKQTDIRVTPNIEAIIKSGDFTTLLRVKIMRTARLRLLDLGFEDFATTARIIGTKDDVDKHGNPAPFTKGRMTELGLELCPPELGIYRRLKDTNQPVGDWYYIGMKPIVDSYGNPRVFCLARHGSGLWWYAHSAGPDYRWYSGCEFVFSLRKVTQDPQNSQKPGFLERFFKR